jgi:hypothetical protein
MMMEMWIAAMALCARGTIALLDDPAVVTFAAKDGGAVVDGIAVGVEDDRGQLVLGGVELEAVAVGDDRGCRAGRWRVKPGPRTRTGLRAALAGEGGAHEFARAVVTFSDGKPHAVTLSVRARGGVTIASDFARGPADGIPLDLRHTSWLFAVGERHGDVQQRLWLTFPVAFGDDVVAALAAKRTMTVEVGEYLHEEAKRAIGAAVFAYVAEVR